MTPHFASDLGDDCSLLWKGSLGLPVKLRRVEELPLGIDLQHADISIQMIRGSLVIHVIFSKYFCTPSSQARIVNNAIHFFLNFIERSSLLDLL